MSLIRPAATTATWERESDVRGARAHGERRPRPLGAQHARFRRHPVRTLGPLTQSECIHLLGTHSLGHLAWQPADGQQVLAAGAVAWLTSATVLTVAVAR
jgi:hypothetical protein